MMAVQNTPSINPMTPHLGSMVVFKGNSKTDPNHNACASTKSIPCLRLSLSLFFGSNSKRIARSSLYKKYTFFANDMVLEMGKAFRRNHAQKKRFIERIGVQDLSTEPISGL
jgi:hypothetical protein